MEAFAFYLIKSSVWLSGFALVYAFFLRNERFFTLNRIFLVSGILISIIFPLFTWHYTVVLPVIPSVEVAELQIQGIAVAEEPFPIQNLMLAFYLAGVISILYRIFRQTIPVFRIIRKSEQYNYRSVKLIRTTEYPASFSFISFVFVNPSIDEIETCEIVNHEQEHIRQKHWIDLLLFEILRTMQWFNPVSWLYGRLIRQNHEYMADERALQRSANPAIYRAALLNQMFGGPVISLANSFNYSLNKKRFAMMKHTINSPFRKLKLLLVLPLIAAVFYAFAAPEYQFVQSGNTNLVNEKTVAGKVISDDGQPLKGASVIVSGKTIGTITDASGNFIIKLTDDSPLVISYVGFESQKVKPDFEKEMLITMKTLIVGIEAMGKDVSISKSLKQTEPSLIIIDGKESSKAVMSSISPEKIEKIAVLKDKMAIEKYGEKAKNGVIEVTLKSNSETSTDQDIKVIGYAKDQKVAPFNKPNSGITLRGSESDSEKPLIVVDGIITENQNLNNMDPETFQSVNVLKNETAKEKYGEKGKNGVVEITTKKESDVFFIVEDMPEFPGGVEALKVYVASNLNYPAIALINGIQGKVFVNFVVAKDGYVTDAKIGRRVDPSLDKEALRIVNNMPKWKPGSHAGEPVRVSYTLPIDFKLPSGKISKEKLKSGKAAKIGAINWENNTVYSTSQLNKLFGLKKGDKYSIQNIRSRIENEVSNIYLDQGYLFANIAISEIPQSDGTVDLKFTVNEGNRGKIGKIDIKGNKNVSTQDILKEIKINPGDLFSKSKIIQSVRALSKTGKFVPEKINPEVIPEAKSGIREFITVNLVFNVSEK